MYADAFKESSSSSKDVYGNIIGDLSMLYLMRFDPDAFNARSREVRLMHS